MRFERKGDKVTVFVNESLDIETNCAFDLPLDQEELFFGGRGNRENSWEGRLDEIVVQRL